MLGRLGRYMQMFDQVATARKEAAAEPYMTKGVKEAKVVSPEMMMMWVDVCDIDITCSHFQVYVLTAEAASQ